MFRYQKKSLKTGEKVIFRAKICFLQIIEDMHNMGYLFLVLSLRNECVSYLHLKKICKSKKKLMSGSILQSENHIFQPPPHQSRFVFFPLVPLSFIFFIILPCLLIFLFAFYILFPLSHQLECIKLKNRLKWTTTIQDTINCRSFFFKPKGPLLLTVLA